jgi:hypothetical protein
VRALIGHLENIRPETEKDFEPLGKVELDEKKALLVATLERTVEGGKPDERATETLLVGEKVPGKEEYYARLSSDDPRSVVRVAAKNVDAVLAVLKNPSSLRSRDLMAALAGVPDAIQVSSGKGLSQVVTLYRPGLFGWKVASGDFRREANENVIHGPDGLLPTLEGRGKVKDFIDVADEKKDGATKDKELGLDAAGATARVAIWMNGLEKEPKKEEKKDAKKDDGKKDEKKEPGKDEKKDGKKDDKKQPEKKEPQKKEEKKDEGPKINPKVQPAVTFTFGKKVKDEVYVKRETADGEISRVTVPAELLEKVAPPEGALAYLDSNLSPFFEPNVVKLELSRPGEKKVVLELEQPKDKADKKGETWKLVEPKDLPGKDVADANAVREVLGVLSRLAAKRWVKKVASKDELGEFGLKSPQVTVTVTLKKEDDKKEPQQFVYEFGSETKNEKDRPAIFGIASGSDDLKDLVFLVPTDVVRTLREAEFRDRTVFSFDADKVKEVKMMIVATAFTLEPVFERTKDRTWTVKGLAKFNLDGDKLDRLVEELSRQRAERYVSFSGPDKTHKLGDDAKLKIDLLMDEGKTRYSLTVGGSDGATSYYAESSAMPKVVFLVPQRQFQPLIVDGVAYLSKK